MKLYTRKGHPGPGVCQAVHLLEKMYFYNQKNPKGPANPVDCS